MQRPHNGQASAISSDRVDIQIREASPAVTGVTVRRAGQRFLPLSLLPVLFSLGASWVYSQESSHENVLDATVVETWSDSLFNSLLAEYRISAGVIAVTEGEDVILTKGYGFADKEYAVAVDPASTQFRIASLSKTFIGTGVAQLLESGAIVSLDDPVNDYLKRLQLPDYNGREISIWDLLTHQGGLGQMDEIGNDPRPAAPLGPELVIANMPGIAHEPGQLSLYCNACAATLGIMLEDITGMPVNEYMQAHIFKPLSMPSSDFYSSSTPPPGMVKHYTFSPGKPAVTMPFPAAGSPFTYYSGAVISTANDMARWLISNVQQGQGETPALLSPQTYQLLHTRHRGNHPQSGGFGMTFFTYEYNGEPLLEHYGSITHRSLQLMMLDRRIGVFIAVVGGGPADGEVGAPAGASLPADAIVLDQASHSGLRAAVLEHFLGKLGVPDQVTDDDLSAYVGIYDPIQEGPADLWQQGDGLMVRMEGDGLRIGDIGVYYSSGPDTVVLQGTLPLDAGFRLGNRYSFQISEDGEVRMYPHVNAGGYQRRRPGVAHLSQ